MGVWGRLHFPTQELLVVVGDLLWLCRRLCIGMRQQASLRTEQRALLQGTEQEALLVTQLKACATEQKDL
eukprot:scaffold182226_cov19-Tisochrysis_lutea.AAC.3